MLVNTDSKCVEKKYKNLDFATTHGSVRLLKTNEEKDVKKKVSWRWGSNGSLYK